MRTTKELAAKIAALSRQHDVHGTDAVALSNLAIAYQISRANDASDADHATSVVLGYGDEKKRTFVGNLPKGFYPASIEVVAGHIHVAADANGSINYGDELKGEVTDAGKITLTFDKPVAKDDKVEVFYDTKTD